MNPSTSSIFLKFLVGSFGSSYNKVINTIADCINSDELAAIVIVINTSMQCFVIILGIITIGTTQYTD